MRRVNASDFKTQFEEFLALVGHEPIEVLRGGKTVGVFLSAEDFEHLQSLDDAHWASKAQAAVERGEFRTAEETKDWIGKRLLRTLKR